MPVILHPGAVDSVTGSCHELRLGDGREVPIDCSLFPGAVEGAEGASAARLEIGFTGTPIQSLILTPFKIDHVGYLRR